MGIVETGVGGWFLSVISAGRKIYLPPQATPPPFFLKQLSSSFSAHYCSNALWLKALLAATALPGETTNTAEGLLWQFR